MKGMISKWYYRDRKNKGLNTVTRFDDHYHCDCHSYRQEKSCVHIHSTRHQMFYGLVSFQVMGYALVRFENCRHPYISQEGSVVLAYEYSKDDDALVNTVYTLAKAGYDGEAIHNLLGIRLDWDLGAVSNYIAMYGYRAAS